MYLTVEQQQQLQQIDKLYDKNNEKNAYILVTGGAGYIGSHTTLSLLKSGYKVVIVDNLCNSYKESIQRVRFLSECDKKDLIFIKASVNDKFALSKIFEKYKISAVIHFAGLKSVTESIHHPLRYYRNNVTATCVLLECMALYGCKRIVFSSSATVYGNTSEAYIKETARVSPLTPYGRSKLMCEEVIVDTCKSGKDLSAAILRYFNPVGCHESGLIGENPRNAPNNLMPCVTGAMLSNIPMCVFGKDYNTKDGTAIRDFIHVVDLADGHVAALRKLEQIGEKASNAENFCEIYNMGNGVGSTVKEVISMMEEVTTILVPHNYVKRRDGDAECVVADPSKSYTELVWKPNLTLEQMCKSAWNWQKKNPNGYRKNKPITKNLLAKIIKLIELAPLTHVRWEDCK
jgi:UDP-glucose 4-epimerase